MPRQTGPNMVWMGVVRVAGFDGLLRGEIPLLFLGNRHKCGKRIVLLRHAHILNFFEELCKPAACSFAATLLLSGTLHPYSESFVFIGDGAAKTRGPEHQ